MNRLLCGSLLSATLAAAACSGDAPPATMMQPLAVDYHHDAAPVLDRYCIGCHTAGGIAPFALTDYNSAKTAAQSIKSAVQSGLMPPWMPSDASMPLRYSRAMRSQDRDLLLSWIDAGTPEGDASEQPRTDIPPAEVVAPPRPDLVLDPGKTYQPDTSQSDDYHCFVFDPMLTADTFLQAGTIVPGNQAIVHHVLLYEILAADAATIQQANAGGNGYTCFGGPSGSGMSLSSQGKLTTVFAWVPGSVPARFPDGTALRLHAGSLLVMQVHYNTLANNGKGDRSTVQLERNPTAPAKELRVVPFANPKGLSIKAGDPSAKQVVTAPVSIVEQLTGLPSGDLIVYSNAPHMHLLGKRVVTSLAGQTMVEIPRWDYHWQQSYTFTTPLIAHAADLVQLECDYDNSFANQPYINGQQSPPRDVSWGESTLDEMCLTFLTVTPNG
jgi:hypothetical protein